jgi:DNA processing protein
VQSSEILPDFQAQAHKTMSTLTQDALSTVTPLLDEERLAWLALVLAPGLGPKRILDAMKQLEAVSQIFTLPLTALEGLRFPAGAAQFIFDGKARQAAEEEWARVVAQGATVLTYGCPEYPERLKEISWARGTPPPTAREWRRFSLATWLCAVC